MFRLIECIVKVGTESLIMSKRFKFKFTISDTIIM